MNRVIQTIVVIGLFSTIGCATTPAKKQHTAAEAYLTEVHAEEVALSRMLYSDDLETARAARELGATRATK